jgi:hypothetical protein
MFGYSNKKLKYKKTKSVNLTITVDIVIKRVNLWRKTNKIEER